MSYIIEELAAMKGVPEPVRFALLMLSDKCIAQAAEIKRLTETKGSNVHYTHSQIT